MTRNVMGARASSVGRMVRVETDMSAQMGHVRFSNRPFGVKHFQTIHHHSVDVARGLVLLFGIGTRALPSWDSRTRWNSRHNILWFKQVEQVPLGRHDIPIARTD